jgi:hypothetical protein
MKLAARLACLLFLFSSLSYARNVSGSIQGIIVDPSGAPVPGAACNLTGKATGMARAAQSDAVLLDAQWARTHNRATMRERLVLLALFLTIPAGAQEPRGSIAGRATDVSDAVIPGVALRATNVETGVVARAVTNANGAYDLPFLLPGEYRVEAEKAGFKTWSQAGITLRMEDNLRLDIRMEVGAVT